MSCPGRTKQFLDGGTRLLFLGDQRTINAVLQIVREEAGLTFILLKIDVGGGQNCAKV